MLAKRYVDKSIKTFNHFIYLPLFLISRHDSEFITKLRDYSDEGVHRDIVEISSGKEQLNEFRKIVTHSATELNK